jgi:hypothetical protein
MADIISPNSHPNILTVTGNDVFGSDSDFRGRLRDVLYGNNILVTRGSHDCWITYRVPDVPPADMDSNWWYEDIGIGDGATRRPMRGIVFMRLPTDDSDNTMVAQVGTLLQEVAHHWLVPRDLKFSSPRGELGMYDLREIVHTQNNDQGWTLPALLGRENIHWSSYWDADHSPFDGVHWIDRGVGDGLVRWDQQLSPEWDTIQQSTAVQVGPSQVWTPPPPRRIRLRAKYNDLDLILMDGLNPSNAYPDSGNTVRWLQPILTSNMNYHAGITVALSRYDQIYFGFYKDHRKLAVQRTGQQPSPIADLGERRNVFSHTLLRIVRRGQQLLFQAADPEYGDIVGAPSNDTLPFRGLERNRFNTVEILNVPDIPIGVGALVKTWSPILVEADYTDFQLFDALGHRRLLETTPRDIPEFRRNDPYDSALSSDEIRRYDMPGPSTPERASFVRIHPQERLLQIGTRYCVIPLTGDPVNLPDADHWGSVDRAPKALVRVQRGDFTFGVRMRVRRCIFTPWTAGGAVGTSMWGHRGRALARDTIIPPHNRERWRGNSFLQIAFIIVARQLSDITADQLAIIDNIRRFWDPAFNAATRGRWTSSSSLFPEVYTP